MGEAHPPSDYMACLWSAPAQIRSSRCSLNAVSPFTESSANMNELVLNEDTNATNSSGNSSNSSESNVGVATSACSEKQALHLWPHVFHFLLILQARFLL